MQQRFETFTVLIAKISRSIRRIKAEEMSEFHLKGPHVSCLYYLTQLGPLTAGQLCDRCEEDKAAVSRSLEYLEQNEPTLCDQLMLEGTLQSGDTARICLRDGKVTIEKEAAPVKEQSEGAAV